MAGIHCVRCLNYSELLSQAALMQDFIDEHPKVTKSVLLGGNLFLDALNVQVKLLVIDSIAFPFRQESMDPSVRSRILGGLAQSLLHLASDNQLAVSY